MIINFADRELWSQVNPFVSDAKSRLFVFLLSFSVGDDDKASSPFVSFQKENIHSYNVFFVRSLLKTR